MVDLGIVNDEIAELEASENTTYDVCNRLAILYTVRSNLGGGDVRDAEPKVGGTEFLDLAASVGFARFAEVMQAHMDALKVVLPKEHAAVMAKLGRTETEGGGE